MKPLINYINESIDAALRIINEEFQSKILNDFFLDAKNKLTSRRPLPMLVINTMNWKGMTDDDVVLLTPEEAYRRIYARSSDSNEFFVWSLNDGYMVVSVGKDLIANFAGFPYMTIKSLYKSGDAKEVLEVKDWKKFDTSFLRELRRQQNQNSKNLKDVLSTAKKTDDYYDNILKDKDISKFADLTEKVKSTISAYKEMVNYISDNINAIGPVWNYKMTSRLNEMSSFVENIMLAVVEIQPDINVTDSKNRIIQDCSALLEKIDRFKILIGDFIE